jgi:glycosyltransferase involved in cell wall biosynthesis
MDSGIVNFPKVSVICTSYNHQDYVLEALNSVMSQTYPNIELIVVDDNSSDKSANRILQFQARNPETLVILNDKTLGICKSFNKGFRNSSGAYLIDLAADDILHNDRIEKGVQSLENLGKPFGVNFCDCEIIDQASETLGYQYKGKINYNKVPQGEVFASLLSRHWISSPTLLFKREVIEKLRGYDETLSFEDFDFWVRSSRYYHYSFTPEVLVTKRKLHDSLSPVQYQLHNSHIRSIIYVCKKAAVLVREKRERKALQKRIVIEMRRAIKTHNIREAKAFLQLLRSTGSFFRFWGYHFLVSSFRSMLR